VALFDSGSSIGGAIAAPLALALYHLFGWQPVFIITGTLGLLWLWVFRAVYRTPEEHPRLSPEERAYIIAGRNEGGDPSATGAETLTKAGLPYGTLLTLRQTWGYVISKAFTDPVWFFITDWLAIVLVAKGFKLEESLMGFWVPFLAADLGNFFGGGLSSILIQRGWTVGAARRFVGMLCGFGMMLIIPAAWTSSFAVFVACFAVATFMYAAFSTVILNLPADIFPPRAVATVSGMGGSGAGIGTMFASYLTGRVSDVYSFTPIVIAAGILPLVAVIAMLTLVRNTAATRAGIVRPI